MTRPIWWVHSFLTIGRIVRETGRGGQREEDVRRIRLRGLTYESADTGQYRAIGEVLSLGWHRHLFLARSFSGKPSDEKRV